LSIKRKARSYFLNAVLSPSSRRLQRSSRELRRKLTGSAHEVSVFLQLDDPYSYLLARYLPELQASFDIELMVYLSQARGDEYQPAPEMLSEYAVIDAHPRLSIVADCSTSLPLTPGNRTSPTSCETYWKPIGAATVKPLRGARIPARLAPRTR
jgi:hypothetical protein